MLDQEQRFAGLLANPGIFDNSFPKRPGDTRLKLRQAVGAHMGGVPPCAQYWFAERVSPQSAAGH